jgi:hypothetical protein
MTRALSAKAGAALLRKAFSNKGAALTHTEALDLLAQLQGYNAWSHLQQAQGSADAGADRPVHAEAPAETAVPALLPLHAVLLSHYGKHGSCPAYPRERWEREAPGQYYWNWVLQRIEQDRPEDVVRGFDVNNDVVVTLPDGRHAVWDIEQNLSTRCGELNDAFRERKPGLALLQLDTPLYERLCAQMWDEMTFMVRKDGQMGLLFEAEFLSQESEARNDEDVSQYKPRDEVIAALVRQLAVLEKQYPQVEFCVPDPAEIWEERPAVWGFFQLDALTQEQREALGRALLDM